MTTLKLLVSLNDTIGIINSTLKASDNFIEYKKTIKILSNSN